ncbi:MAG: NAD(P)H-dependent oxidoreductase subunit E [bacterium]|nr:NAD(P)H-dependent oxidoreductase subunit E [bacterium]
MNQGRPEAAARPVVPEELADRAHAIVAAYPEPKGALHPLLDLVLSETGSWDGTWAGWVAQLTGTPVVTVHGIARSRRLPEADGEEIAVCTGLSCRWMGAEAVCQRLQEVPNIRVVAVNCLGACSAAPAMARNGRLHDGLTPERLDALVAGDR